MGGDKVGRRVEMIHVSLCKRYHICLMQTDDDHNTFEVYTGGAVPSPASLADLKVVCEHFPSLRPVKREVDFTRVWLSDNDLVHAAFMESVDIR